MGDGDGSDANILTDDDDFRSLLNVNPFVALEGIHGNLHDFADEGDGAFFVDGGDFDLDMDLIGGASDFLDDSAAFLA